jgi:hypothetical protein
VVEFLGKLEVHRRLCEENGNYEEAKIARLKYEEVRGQQVAYKLDEIKAHQVSEKR